MIEPHLINIIKTSPEVSGDLSDRIYTLKASKRPQFPLVTLQSISSSRSLLVSGGDGLVRGRIQLDVFDRTYSNLRSVSKKIVDLLHGYSDDIIISSSIDGEQYLFDDESDLYRTIFDFLIHYKDN